MNEITITMYFVGIDNEDAQTTFPFDSYERAEEYMLAESSDDNVLHIYEAYATIDLSSLTLSD